MALLQNAIDRSLAGVLGVQQRSGRTMSGSFPTLHGSDLDLDLPLSATRRRPRHAAQFDGREEIMNVNISEKKCDRTTIPKLTPTKVTPEFQSVTLS